MKLTIQDKENHILKTLEGKEEINLFYENAYEEGDKIIFEPEELPGFYQLQLDDAKGHSLLYLTKPLTYIIPFGEKRVNISPKVFSGEKHLLHARKARSFETENYRNLAVNVYDSHHTDGCYPHASANVETRGESVFAAMNAIDGVTASPSHGKWPYESWGINMQDDARLQLEFGREVRIDRIIIYLRSDFPHDNYWKEATVTFSDGSSMLLPLIKSGEAQEFTFPEKNIFALSLHDLIKGETESPFPALIQIEVYGRETKAQ